MVVYVETDWGRGPYADFSACVTTEGKEGIWEHVSDTGEFQYYCHSLESLAQYIQDYGEGYTTEYWPWLMSYITISENVLLQMLTTNINDIVAAVGYDITQGTSATSALLAGVENSLNNMLGNIETDLLINHNDMTSRLTTVESNITTNFTGVNDKLDIISSAVTSTDTGLIQTLQDFFSGIIDTMWYGLQDLITEVQNTFLGIVTWFSDSWAFMLTSLETVMVPLLDSIWASLQATLIQIWTAIDLALQPVVDIIISLGDIYDWFAIDFFNWLDTTFSFSEADLTTGFSLIMDLFKGLIGETVAKPMESPPI